MVPERRHVLEKAESLAAAGHLSAATGILSSAAEAGCPDARLRLIEICLERRMPREAAIHARTLLRQESGHARAQLRLGEALLMLDQGDEALKALPDRPHAGEETRLAAARMRAELASMRRAGVELWQTGRFDEGRDLYRRLHEKEEKARTQFRAVLDDDPASAAAWDVLTDAAGNYRLFHALAQALPQPENLQRIFFELITGRPDHPARKHRQPVAATFRSLTDWPRKDEVVKSQPSNPHAFLPSRFGNETRHALPARTGQRQVVRLKDALVYDAGIYLWVRSAEGNAPWLQEGVWGGHVAAHLPFVLPLPHVLLEGEGLGNVLCTLPAAARRVEQPVVVLGYWNNYGHVLHDIIPQLEDAEAALGRDFRILAVDALLPQIRDVFTRAGYGPERLISIGERRTAILREAYCLTPRTSFQRLRRFRFPASPDFRHYEVALDDEGIKFARRRLTGDRTKMPGSATRKVYASRRHTARHPDNEREIEAMLAAQGFEIIVPEALTFAEQVELFAETRMLVALEGAALANMMFMPEGGAVLALRSLAWGWSVNCFEELARIGGLIFETLDFEGRQAPLDAVQKKLQAFSATT